MNRLRFDVPLDGLPDIRAAALQGDSVFAVVLEPRDIRRLRAGLMDAARVLSADSEMHRRSILVLVEPLISDERIRAEWKGLRRLLRPEITGSLILVIGRAGRPMEVLGLLSSEERNALERVIEHARQQPIRPRSRSSGAFDDIFRVLLIHWFRKSGPLALKDLCFQAGFSYPTTANVLERLEPSLLRHSDRKVELRSFPRDDWFKLVANSEKARGTQGYTDRSGRPRSTDILLKRLRELNHDEIAVGGVLGARHYLPGLDIVGTPRLDLVVHARLGAIPPHFLRSLDPALVPAERGEPCRVVLHTLFRPESFFSEPQDGLRWADEVECLLDLHEARLESQALEYLDRLSPKPRP